ncbi:hypothetical protein NBRC116584_24220 [Hydrogenophaga sp. 5NK40-0174]
MGSDMISSLIDGPAQAITSRKEGSGGRHLSFDTLLQATVNRPGNRGGQFCALPLDVGSGAEAKDKT